ncbi:MAG: adaptor protein MecA [Defluviitaleaceae bacterium]|nr:adaptor protein MecA [Defluviitaleaceae bacterium]
MRIERISDTQMKFVLMTDDLEERDIKINELSYASDKTQQLFREIMTLVQDEQEFVVGDTPLMFEAMRVGVDSLVVVVTKINENGGIEAERKFNLIPAARQECRFKKPAPIKQPFIEGEDSYVVFSFDCLDTMAMAAARLPANFKGLSQAYKMENRYFLTFTNETEDTRTTAELEAALHEYGQKHVSNVVSRLYLMERGETIIAENAVDKLRAYMEAQI